MAYRWLGVLLLSVACSAGCGNDGTGDPRGSGSSGGNGGAGGIGGAAGQTGTGGTGGAGATECLTSPICRSCPTEGFCDNDDDCTLGSACIESGCTDLGGSPIGQCVFAGGGACNSIADCPPERECLEVPLEGKRCVKTTPGCTTRFDCLPGFSCENDVCVTRACRWVSRASAYESTSTARTSSTASSSLSAARTSMATATKSVPTCSIRTRPHRSPA